MCKQAIDENFCDCQTGTLRLIDESAANNVRNEVYVSKFNREEKKKKVTIDFEDGSNVLSFGLGVVVTFIVIGIGLLIAYLVIRRHREHKKTGILS